MSTYTPTSGDFDWYVSSTCDGGQCIRVARQDQLVLIGNTNQPDLITKFTIDEWRKFLEGVKLGDFDRIA
jgi:hypothetical protein